MSLPKLHLKLKTTIYGFVKKIFLLIHYVFDHFLYILNKRKVSDLQPVFIVGCGHSGTSLMLSMLDSHTILYGIPYESRVFLEPNKHSIITKALAWQQECLYAGKSTWVEKTPKHVYFLGKVLKTFPNSKVIIMMRDGRDVACSIKAKVGCLSHGIKEWKNSITAIEEYIDDDRIKIVKLEWLVSNRELALKEICDFLEIEYEEEMLSYHKVRRFYYSRVIKKPYTASDGENHLALRNWQINQPLFNNTSRWKDEMSLEERARFKVEAQELLEKFGYELSSEW